jgi:hypothetical protein
MTEVAHMGSEEDKITLAIKETIAFEWIVIWLFASPPKNSNGIARSIARITIPWWRKRTNISTSEASRQRATKRKMTILPHKSVSRKVIPLYFSPIASGGQCENCRGISLLNVIYKIFTYITQYLETYTEEVLGDHQCVFRKGQSTTDQILTLR